MNILAIDFGSKHIGLAKGDDQNKIALPFLSLENNGLNKLINDLKEIVKNENIEEIVVGLPLNMSGQKTDQTKKTEYFAERLGKEINIKIILEDERLTSFGAKKLGSDVDEHQLAAREILQGYLDKN
ncbi:MAG: Holliday junction resolvase RuvX [Patescibacteria group bacterium]|jgi:putative Holliday junction resolvase